MVYTWNGWFLDHRQVPYAALGVGAMPGVPLPPGITFATEEGFRRPLWWLRGATQLETDPPVIELSDSRSVVICTHMVDISWSLARHGQESGETRHWTLLFDSSSSDHWVPNRCMDAMVMMLNLPSNMLPTGPSPTCRFPPETQRIVRWKIQPPSWKCYRVWVTPVHNAAWCFKL